VKRWADLELRKGKNLSISPQTLTVCTLRPWSFPFTSFSIHHSSPLSHLSLKTHAPEKLSLKKLRPRSSSNSPRLFPKS
jgi:hypothetical protein